MKYIGQTSKEYISNRWSEHKWKANSNRSNLLIHQAIREFGANNFEFTVILFHVPQNELWDKEIEYIERIGTLAPNGYNETKGGGGTLGFEPWDKGIKRIQETRNKISKAYTEERRNKMREIFKEKWRQNLFEPKGTSRPGELNPFYGKHHTDETKERLSKIQNGKKKRIKMLDKDTGNVIQIFNSIAEAAKYIKKITGNEKVDDSAISKCARGISKIAYGYKWELMGGQHGTW